MVNITLLIKFCITIQYEQGPPNPNYCSVAAQAYLCEVRVHNGIAHCLDVSEDLGAFRALQEAAVPISQTAPTDVTHMYYRNPQASAFPPFYGTGGLARPKSPGTKLATINPFP